MTSRVPFTRDTTTSQHGQMSRVVFDWFRPHGYSPLVNRVNRRICIRTSTPRQTAGDAVGRHCQLGSLVTNLQAQRRCKPRS